MNVKEILCNGVARFLGRVYAKEFVGNLTGNADAATSDASGNVITDTYMTKTNPTGSGSLSIGRLDGSTVGSYSTALGYNTTASNYASYAEGLLTKSSGLGSHTEGGNTIASIAYAHAEGVYTTASGDASHAEGSQTKSSGSYSHAGGNKATAHGKSSFIHGEGSNYLPSTLDLSTATKDEIKTAWDGSKFALAYGDNSFAVGKDCLALGNRSIAMGNEVVVEDDDTLGVNNIQCNSIKVAGTDIVNINDFIIKSLPWKVWEATKSNEYYGTMFNKYGIAYPSESTVDVYWLLLQNGAIVEYHYNGARKTPTYTILSGTIPDDYVLSTVAPYSTGYIYYAKGTSITECVNIGVIKKSELVSTSIITS